MSGRLRSELYRILTEPCALRHDLSVFDRHMFEPAGARDTLIVRCRFCGLELNLAAVTYSPSPGSAPACRPGSQPDEPPPEWLSREFHDSPCFRLPRKSGPIEPSLFWYFVEYFRDSRIPEPEFKAGQRYDQISHHGYRSNGEYIITDLRGLDNLSGVMRVFFIRDYRPLDDLAWSVEEIMEYGAQYNLRKLLTGKFKPEHEPEAKAEIENQLSYISPITRKQKRPRAVFNRFLAWKQAHPNRGASHGQHLSPKLLGSTWQ